MGKVSSLWALFSICSAKYDITLVNFSLVTSLLCCSIPADRCVVYGQGPIIKKLSPKLHRVFGSCQVTDFQRGMFLFFYILYQVLYSMANLAFKLQV